MLKTESNDNCCFSSFILLVFFVLPHGIDYFRIKDVESEAINIAAEEEKTSRKIRDINLKKYRNLQEYFSNTKVHVM